VNDEVGFKANLAVNIFYFPAMLLPARVVESAT
jgi:hypothetical protein